MPVNPTKTKHLNPTFCAARATEGDPARTAIKESLERSLEYIAQDEYVEATPKNLRPPQENPQCTQRKRRRDVRRPPSPLLRETGLWGVRSAPARSLNN